MRERNSVWDYQWVGKERERERERETKGVCLNVESDVSKSWLEIF